MWGFSLSCLYSGLVDVDLRLDLQPPVLFWVF